MAVTKFNVKQISVNAAWSPDTSDAVALGSASKMWSDAFLASGAVINFNNGDVTLTHSSNLLSIAGGNTRVERLEIDGATNYLDVDTDLKLVSAADLEITAASIKPASDNGVALGESSLGFADLFLASGAVVNFNAGDITLTHSSNTLTVAGGTLATAALTTSTIVASGIIKTDDTTEATSTTDGSLQTDGGLSVAKSAVIGDDLDLLSDGAIMNIGSTSKFTITDQAANNCVMAASGHRLAFGNAGEYISGDGTDLDIVSSGDLDISATLVDITGALTVSGTLSMAGDLVHTGDTNNKIAFGTDTQSFETGGTARMNLSDSGLQVGTGARVTTILDEDAMGSNSATALATQQSIKAYVDASSAGMDLKDSVAAAYTASFTMASTASSSTLVLASGEGGWTAAGSSSVASSFASYLNYSSPAKLSTSSAVMMVSTGASSTLASVASGDSISITLSGVTWSATATAGYSATTTKTSSFGSYLASTGLTGSSSSVSPGGSGWPDSLLHNIASGDTITIGSWSATVSSVPSSSSSAISVSSASGTQSEINGGISTSISGPGVAVSSAALSGGAAFVPNGGASSSITRTTSASYSVDGVTISADDRVLVKDGVNSNSAGVHNKWNGVYTVGSLSGSTVTLTRATDFDAASEFIGAPFFLVDAGTDNGAHGFVCSLASSPTIGTDAITFYQFSAPGQDSVAGTGLSMTGNVLSVDAAQTQITSVGALAAGSISSGFGNIDNGSSTLDTGAATVASMVCTAGATFGGGLGSSGVTISTAGAISADARIVTDDTTEATSTTDGSIQTDGGLSVAKSVVIGDDLDLLSDGAIMNIGSTSKFTITDQAANNCVMAASGHRLAFGNAGEYISGDGTDLDIISSGDLDITATLVDITGALTVSGTVSMAADLVHTGDTNNKISFGTDTQSFETGGTARINLSDSGLQIGTGARVTTILDEDGMGTDSATALATQQSIKAYVDAQLTAQDLDFTTDTGSGGSVDLDSQSLSILGGSGVGVTHSGQSITVAMNTHRETVFMSNGNSDSNSIDMDAGDVKGNFAAAEDIVSGSLRVYLNGMLLREGSSYDYQHTARSSSTPGYITLASGLSLDSDDVVICHYVLA